MKISVVATLYQSAAFIGEFLDRTRAAVEKLTSDYEIILVDDGSPDDSLRTALAQLPRHPRVKVIELSRNFGHHKAMMTGLAHARGEYVFLIDTDLEEDPEWLPGFVEQMALEKCDVVFGVQARRKGGRFERWSGRWFYRIFRLLTGMELPENMVTARLMTRRYVDALLRHEERELDIGGLWYITGFEQRPQTVRKRSSSATTYTIRRRLALFVNSITSFSNAPLVYIFYTGLVISLLAGCYALFAVIQWLSLAEPVSGWTSVIVSIWLLGGWIILFIGIIGIYLSKVFLEVKRRPYTIVRQVYGQGKSERQI